MEKTVCFTGHRTIPESDFEALNSALREEIQKQIENGASTFRTGGARGFDTMAALAVLSFKKANPHIRLSLILPCPSQTNGWPQNDIEVFEQIRLCADEVHYQSSFYYNGILQVRNRSLVHGADVCIAYLRSSEGGGSAYTSALALKEGLEFVNLQEKI